MNVKLSESVQRKLAGFAKKNLYLLNRVQKQLSLFQQNISHPSLRVHKLSGQLKNSYSLSISQKIRMVYTVQSENTAYLFDIGSHGEVYHK